MKHTKLVSLVAKFRSTTGWKAICHSVLVSALFVMLTATFANIPNVSALTTVPTLINFQGRLTTPTGSIVADGTYNMQFRLYDAVSGGTLKWSEERLVNDSKGVVVTNGLFAIKLGQGDIIGATGGATPIDPAIFASGSLYLEITMPNPANAVTNTASASMSWESPMSPRNQLATSAYAFNSETLDGLDSTAFGQLSTNNTYTGTNLFSVTSATAFQVQNASSVGVLTVDTSAGQLTLGTVGTLGGKLSISGASSGNVSLSVASAVTSYNLVLPGSAPTAGQCLKGGAVTAVNLEWGSCGGGGGGVSRTVKLVPEYPGGVLRADGANNNGTMTSDYVSGLVSGQGYKHNYYQWTNTTGSANDYDIVINTAIPSEYVSGLGGLKIWTYSSQLTNGTATIQFQDNAGTNCYASPVAITPGSTNTWAEITVGAMSGCTFSANDVVTITIHLVSQSSALFRVGEVTYTYTN